MTDARPAEDGFDPNPPPNEGSWPSDPLVDAETGLTVSALLGAIQWPIVPGWAAGEEPDGSTDFTGAGDLG